MPVLFFHINEADIPHQVNRRLTPCKLLDRMHLARIPLKPAVRFLVFSTALVVCLGEHLFAQVADPAPYAATFNKYCVTCHNDKARTGGLSLQSADLADPGRNAETWEKAIRKLRTGA